jgi:hypothetical protein
MENVPWNPWLGGASHEKGLPTRPGMLLKYGLYAGLRRECTAAFLTMPKFFCIAVNQPIDGSVPHH